MSSNERQVGGDHYQQEDGIAQHWDFTWEHHYNQFEYCASKYVERYESKNGLQDLEKAKHHLEKYLEVLVKAGVPLERNYQHICSRGHALKWHTLQWAVLDCIFSGEVEKALNLLNRLIEYTIAEEADAEADKNYTNQE